MTIALRARETANAPGTSATVNLLGPPAGFRGLLTAFANGASVSYMIFEPSTGQWEHGVGTVNTGSPNTLTRPATVLRNSAGTTSRVNFAAAVEITVVLSDDPTTAQTSLGGTTVGRAVFSAVDTAAARAAIEAAPVPINTAGLGQAVAVNVAAQTHTAPAGGSWFIYLLGFGGGGTLANANLCGVVAGGTVSDLGSPVTTIRGFVWRLA